MYRYISSFSVKTLHSMVNKAMLHMLCNVRKGPIYVAATDSTLPSLLESLPDRRDEILASSLHVTKSNGRSALLLRYLQSAFWNIVELIKSKKGDTLIYNFNNVFSLSILNFLGKHIFKGRRIIIICHSELEYLAHDFKHAARYKRLMAWLTRRFFLRKDASGVAPQLYFIVLGDDIKEKLREYVSPTLCERIESIDHPVIDFDIIPSNSNRDYRRINVGTVGILNRYKGAEEYIRIIEALKDNRDMEFNVVGQIQSDLDRFRALGVKTGNNPAEALPQEEFSSMVANLDYILLLYPVDNYALTASGAILDTLRFRKPVIALANPYFKYFFKKYGSVGILNDNIEDVIEKIKNLKSLKSNEYQFEKILSELSPETLSTRFDTILSKFEKIG